MQRSKKNDFSITLIFQKTSNLNKKPQTIIWSVDSSYVCAKSNFGDNELLLFQSVYRCRCFKKIDKKQTYFSVEM